MKKDREIFQQLQVVVDEWKKKHSELTEDEQISVIADNFGAMLFCMEVCDGIPTETIVEFKRKEVGVIDRLFQKANFVFYGDKKPEDPQEN